MVFDIANKEITVDKTLKVDVDGYEVLVKVMYDKKIKHIKRKHAFDHIILRVPVGTDDERIKKHLHQWQIKEWINEIKPDPESQHVDQMENDIKRYDIKLIDRSMEEFKKIVERNVEKHVPRFGRPKQLIYKYLEEAWAECNQKKDKLTFNPNLRYLPDEYIEFVVYHEMIHLYCLNHNPPFQREMEKVYPDWKEWNRRLRLCSYLLFKKEKYI